MQILPYSYRNPKCRFSAFFSKTVTPRYIRPIYQMKERKILYKKGIHESFTIFSHSAANRIWKINKPFLDCFLHFSQKIFISRYMKHGYQMKEHKILYKKSLLSLYHFEPFSGKLQFKKPKKGFCTFFQKHTLWNHSNSKLTVKIFFGNYQIRV